MPPGFAMTAFAHWNFIEAHNLKNVIARALTELSAGKSAFSEIGQSLACAIVQGEWPKDTVQSIATAYAEPCHRTNAERVNREVRSYATAEDLPAASFAVLASRDALAQA